MATNAARLTGPSCNLREEYAAAEAEERAAWRYLNDSSLEESERRTVYARWELAASLTRVLAIKLQGTGSEDSSH